MMTFCYLAQFGRYTSNAVRKRGSQIWVHWDPASWEEGVANGQESRRVDKISDRA